VTVSPYTFDVGSWECAVLHDGEATFPVKAFFESTPAPELERALTAVHLAPDALPLTINLLLARNESHSVLIDTGIGRDVGGGEGQLLARLATAGVTPDDIDVVAITHCHWDHIGGLTDDAGRLIFPDARHVMSATEWALWTSAEALAGMAPMLERMARENLTPLRDRIELLAGGDEVVPGLTFVAAPGHTPGQVAYLMASGAQELLHIGDVAHHPLQVLFPEITPEIDLQPAESVSTRRRLLQRAAERGMLLLASHFPFPGTGRVVSAGDSWAWRPLPSYGARCSDDEK